MEHECSIVYKKLSSPIRQRRDETVPPLGGHDATRAGGGRALIAPRFTLDRGVLYLPHLEIVNTY